MAYKRPQAVIGCRLPNALCAQIKVMALADGLTVSELVGQWVREKASEHHVKAHPVAKVVPAPPVYQAVLAPLVAKAVPAPLVARIVGRKKVGETMAKKLETEQVPENGFPETCEIIWEQGSDGKLIFKGLSCETDVDTEMAYQAMERAEEFIVRKKPIKSG